MPTDAENTRISTNQHLIRAEISPSTVNEAERTVEMVFATDRPVRSYDWRADTYFDEVLDMSSSSVRLERMQAGAPLLDNHNRWGGVGSQLGVVTAVRLDGNKGYCTVRFSNRDDVSGVWQDVKDGIIRNVSVGYKVHKYQKEETQNTNEVPVYRAIDWEPMEVSLVPIPADPGAGLRGEKQVTYEATIINPNPAMPEANANIEGQRSEGTTHVVTPAPAQQPVAEPAAPAQNTDAERGTPATANRVAEITRMVRSVGLPDSYALELVGNPSTTIDSARAAIIERLAVNQQQDQTPIRGEAPAGQPGVSQGTTGDERFRTDAENAFLLRSSGYSAEALGITPEQKRAASWFLDASPVDIARMCLERSGVKNIPMNKEAIIKMALGQSERSGATSNSTDFPILLAGTNRRTLLAAYAAEPFDWDKWCAIGSVSDFREFTRVRMHDSFNTLDKVNENGEYKNLAINDGEFEKVKVETYGNTYNLTRKMLINDDLAAFTRLMAMFGRASKRVIQKAVYDRLAENSGLGPVMQDGKTLFHADHGNIATPGAMTADVWDAMRVQMATQKPYGGKVDDFLNYRPEILLCPVSLGSRARLLNNSQYNVDVTNKFQIPNIAAGLFNTIVDTPWLSGSAYYGFVNPNTEPTLEVSFLNGVQEPFMDQELGFHVDGIIYKIRQEFGVAAVGYKGAIRNAGA